MMQRATATTRGNAGARSASHKAARRPYYKRITQMTRGRPISASTPALRPTRTGRFEEDKLRQALTRRIGHGKSRSIHFVLKGGYKVGQPKVYRDKVMLTVHR